MTDPDLVAELDRWLASSPDAYGWHLMRRARDAIVALRDSNEQWNRLCGTIAAEKMSARDEIVALRSLHPALRQAQQLAQVRAEALEEAAQVCETLARVEGTSIAITIRALKENRGAA